VKKKIIPPPASFRLLAAGKQERYPESDAWLLRILIARSDIVQEKMGGGKERKKERKKKKREEERRRWRVSRVSVALTSMPCPVRGRWEVEKGGGREKQEGGRKGEGRLLFLHSLFFHSIHAMLFGDGRREKG